MTDEELIARLRAYSSMDDHLSHRSNTEREASDRIEQLVATNEAIKAKLTKAVKLIDLGVELARWDLNPKLRDDMIYFTTDLKGESHD